MQFGTLGLRATGVQGLNRFVAVVLLFRVGLSFAGPEGGNRGEPKRPTTGSRADSRPTGDDSISGGNGSDRIFAQDGNDTVSAGVGHDSVEGGGKEF